MKRDPRELFSNNPGLFEADSAELLQRVELRLQDSLGRKRYAKPLRILLPMGAAALFALGFFAGQSMDPSEQLPVAGVAIRPENFERDLSVLESVELSEQRNPLEKMGEEKPNTETALDLRRRKALQQGRGVIAQDGLLPFLEEAQASTESVVELSWQEPAIDGDYSLAARLLEEDGGFDSAINRASSEQLMLLADIERATGKRENAMRAFERLLDSYPTDPAAPLAAWSLGGMFEKSGDLASAARSYAQYRGLSPRGDFAEDALSREIRISLALANYRQAEELFARYEERYPEGRAKAALADAMARAGVTAAGINTAGINAASRDAGAP